MRTIVFLFSRLLGGDEQVNKNHFTVPSGNGTIVPLRFKGARRQHEFVKQLNCWVNDEGVLLLVWLCSTGDLCFYDLRTGEILGVVLELLPIPYL